MNEPDPVTPVEIDHALETLARALIRDAWEKIRDGEVRMTSPSEAECVAQIAEEVAWGDGGVAVEVTERARRLVGVPT